MDIIEKINKYNKVASLQYWKGGAVLPDNWLGKQFWPNNPSAFVQAVVDFQQDHDLIVDGKLGPATLRKLKITYPEIKKPSDTSFIRHMERLINVHPDLRLIVENVSKICPIIVLCGYRGESEQEDAFSRGTTRVHYPNSRHNSMPSEAVDLSPDPLDWEDISSFIELSYYVKQSAQALGIKITWGGDWQSFKDYPHYELTR